MSTSSLKKIPPKNSNPDKSRGRVYNTAIAKIHDRSLAEMLVSMGIYDNIKDAYVELTERELEEVKNFRKDKRTPNRWKIARVAVLDPISE